MTEKWVETFNDFPSNIQKSLNALAHNESKLLQKYVKELLVIKETNAEVKEKSKGQPEDFKLQLALTYLIQAITPKVELKDDLPDLTYTDEEKTEVQRLAKMNFHNPKLMFLIKEELDKDHVGDDKGKVTAFLCVASGRLKPMYRISIALRGISSVGKSNLMKACLKNLPDKWYIFGTRFSRPSLEDDIKSFYTIAFSEKTQDPEIIEVLKQVAEDGLQVFKKEQLPDKRWVKGKGEYIDRKATIYSSTEKETDEELSTRYIVYTVIGSPAKYAKVLDDIQKDYSNPWKSIEKELREKEETWISAGLKELELFDRIVIPYAPFIFMNTKKARVQRDSKRFFNLISVIAWLNQYNRIKYEYDGKKFLIASAEDFWWAAYLTEDIFKQSISNVDQDIMDVIECYTKMVKEKRTASLSEALGDMVIEKDQPTFVNRAELQTEMGVSINEIKKRVNVLQRLGIATIEKKRGGSRVFVSLTKSPKIDPLLTYDLPTMYFLVTELESALLGIYSERSLEGQLKVNYIKSLRSFEGKKTLIIWSKITLPIIISLSQDGQQIDINKKDEDKTEISDEGRRILKNLIEIQETLQGQIFSGIETLSNWT